MPLFLSAASAVEMFMYVGNCEAALKFFRREEDASPSGAEHIAESEKGEAGTSKKQKTMLIK